MPRRVVLCIAATFLATAVWSALAILSTSQAIAQVAGATLSGTVTDPSGAAIAGARVAVLNSATGVTRDATTSSSGFYSVPNLISGSYEVTVSATGFSVTKQADITLTVGAQQTLDVSLRIGDANQTVEVTANAALVQLGSSALSGAVESATVRELPLNGRDWASLATLEPGVASVRAHPLGTTQGSRGLGMQMTISGNRPTQNSFRLDGALVNDFSNAGPGSVLGQNLGVDSIQEFTVLTSNYSAEYGFTSGGVINAVTRSGTNAFHGSVFDFLRNDKLDASNYFNNANRLAKSPLRQNQFGASGGWRILKDKLFLFGDYEGVRQSKGTANPQFTISEAVRNGNITNLANGVVTNVTIDPTIRKLLTLLPVANGPGNGVGENANVGQFNWTSLQKSTENFYTFRGDAKLSDKDSLFATYVRDPSFLTIPTTFNTALSRTDAYRTLIVAEETHIIGPSLVNSVRVAMDRTYGLTNHFDNGPGSAINPAANDSSLAMVPGGLARAPQMSLSGTGITLIPGGEHSGTWQDLWNQIFQVYDDAFLTRGKHSVKFGFEFLAQHNDVFAVNGFNGNATFTNRGTPIATSACTQPNGAINASCGTLANFLTDQPRTAVPPADLTKSIKHYIRDKVFGAYVQDDWRIFPNLTLNLGVRYEMQTDPSEKNGNVAFLSSLTGPSTNLTHSFYNRNVTLKNFEPRVGFAWDPFHDGKTAIRGGFGIFDVLPAPYILQLYSATTAPFVTALGTVGPPNTPSPAAGVFPGGIPALAVSATPLQRVWGYVDQNMKRNYVYQFNANIQRQLTPNLTLTVGYSGSRGHNNPLLTEGGNSVQPVDLHNPIPGVGFYWPIPYTLGTNGAGNAALYNPNVGIIRSIFWLSHSYYNGLQVKLEKRMSHGFQAMGSYTWSKSIDDTSGSAAADTFINEWNAPAWYELGMDRGLSAFNVGRNLVINTLWNAPAPKKLGALGNKALGGWQLGAISALSDGIPMTPTMGMDGSDLLGEIFTTIAPPQFLASSTCHSFASAVNPGNPNAYLKPECFGLVPQTAVNTPYCDTVRASNAPGSLGVPGTCPNIRGNLARNMIIGPGLFNVDFSVVKNTYIPKISESFNVQFRAEFFNVMNRTNFAPPTLAANQGGGPLQVINSSAQRLSGFGQITSTQTPARQIQFALKVIW